MWEFGSHSLDPIQQSLQNRLWGLARLTHVANPFSDACVVGKEFGSQPQGTIAKRARPDTTRKPISSARVRASALMRNASSSCTGLAVVFASRYEKLAMHYIGMVTIAIMYRLS